MHPKYLDYILTLFIGTLDVPKVPINSAKDSIQEDQMVLIRSPESCCFMYKAYEP